MSKQEEEDLQKKINDLELQLAPLKKKQLDNYFLKCKEIDEKINRCKNGKDKFELDELLFSASARCNCGAGLAYPTGIGIRGCWYCSDILLGRAIKSTEEGAKIHDSEMPFAFYEIKSEGQSSANGATTRPQEEKEKVIQTENKEIIKTIPENLDEAIEDYLEFYSTSDDFDSINKLSEDKFISITHHGAGQFLRNAWFLWWHEDHDKEWPLIKPKIVKWFNNLGIYHADDMSAIIITSAYRKHRNLELELDKQVQHYKNYWESKGFKDGIYKSK